MRRWKQFTAAFVICWGSLWMSASSCVRAQESVALEKQPRTVAEKIDEFGPVGWCDLTARLDNVAIMLMQEPSTRVFLVGYESEKRTPRYTESRLKTFRHYLVDSRGLDAGRVVFINTGTRASDNQLFELWLVPEGASPPVSEPVPTKAVEISGKLDSYETDDTFYGIYAEMGYSQTEIAHFDFAEKMKEQPESRGYLVIRTAKESLPGAFGRISRRDVRELQKRYDVAADRLQTIDGGVAAGEHAEVELWILPKDAPPPPGVTEKLEAHPPEGFLLDTLSIASPHEDDEQSEWALENLAELLRRDPEARGLLIVRQYEPEAEEAVEGEGAESHPLTDFQKSAGEKVKEDEEPPTDPQAVAEKWKLILNEKFGIEPHRLFVMFGRPSSAGVAQVYVWVAPRNSPLPDPFVVTEDVEEEMPLAEADDPASVAFEDAPPPGL